MPTHRRRSLIVVAILVMTAVGLTGALLTRRSEPHTRDGIYVTTSEIPYIRQAYATAAKRKDLLAQLPCHCGCMKRVPGHDSSLACFKTDHAETCPICMRTAEYADRAADQGRTVEEMKRYLSNVFEFKFD